MEPATSAGAVDSDLAFNVAVSFMTNTNWQSYGGETTLSYFSQMLGLTVQNFLSAATGFAVAVAVDARLHRARKPRARQFLCRCRARDTLCAAAACACVRAVPDLAGRAAKYAAYRCKHHVGGRQQTIAQGPVASQVAIKMLGSNGGGYFNANAAHPYENPTPLSDFAQIGQHCPVADRSGGGLRPHGRRQAARLGAVRRHDGLVRDFVRALLSGGGARQSGFRALGIDQA